MAEILIKNLGLPSENEAVNITILSDGSVIEHFRNERGTWSSYRSGGVKAVELPPHGRLIDADFYKKYAVRVHNSEGKEYIPADYIDIAPTVLEASE